MPYLSIVNEEGVPQETSSKIKLANGLVVQYDPSDLDFLRNINSEDDMDRLLMDYVLTTISEIVRLFSHLPPMCPQAENLKFQNISVRHTTHHCKWDIYSMVSYFSSLLSSGSLIRTGGRTISSSLSSSRLGSWEKKTSRNSPIAAMYGVSFSLPPIHN